jgi:hypothetical protein
MKETLKKLLITAIIFSIMFADAVMDKIIKIIFK